MKKLFLTLISASLLISSFFTQANDDYRRICRMHHEGNIEQYQNELEQNLAESAERIRNIDPEATETTIFLMPDDTEWQSEIETIDDEEAKRALQEIANLQNECLHFKEILQEGMIISELEGAFSG